VLFVLPGFVSILALSLVYAAWGDVPMVRAVFAGLAAAVFAVVVQAVLRIGKRALKSRWHVALAVASFGAIFFFNAPFPAIVLAAALLGLATRKRGLSPFPSGETGPVPVSAAAHPKTGTVPISGTLRTAAAWLAVWWLPVGLLVVACGATSVFVAEALFFSKTACVTFGGAYAVLPYVQQRAVADFHWLSPEAMTHGLALAETTPGPLIQVVQFVGFLGAFHQPGDMNPWAAGVLGSIVTTWVTYVPCFLWIFVGAPYIEVLRGSRALTSALSAITAAVVGVILNLAVWFAIHTMFGSVAIEHHGPLRLYVPEWGTVNWVHVGIAAASAVALLRFNVGMLWVLAGAAVVGLAAGGIAI
jgi:chromate transporter